MLNIFSCAYLYMCLGEMSIQILCSLFKLGCFFVIDVCEFLMYSIYKSLIKHIIYKYFLPFCVVFSLSWWCSLKHKSFKFWWSPNYLFFVFLCFLVSYLRNHWIIQAHKEVKVRLHFFACEYLTKFVEKNFFLLFVLTPFLKSNWP